MSQSMWSLFGTWGYKAGASGSPSLVKGTRVLSIVAHASAGGATVTINGGDAVPIVNGAPPTRIQFLHLLVILTAANNITFTGTDQYWVEYLLPAGS